MARTRTEWYGTPSEEFTDQKKYTEAEASQKLGKCQKQLMEYFDMKSAELEEQMLRSEEVSRRDESQKQEIKSAIEEITKVLENIKQEFGA